MTACLALTLAVIPAWAQPHALPDLGDTVQRLEYDDRWYFQTSLSTVHFEPESHHNNNQRLLNVEWHAPNRWLLGGAFFYNSFDQPSQYLYAGWLWRPLQRFYTLYVKLTGGLLHGYKDEYQNQIPFNNLGVAPALLPAVGVSGRRFASEVIVFGLSGAIWTVGFYFK